MSKFLADGGGLPSMENPVICSFWVYMINHSCPYDSRKSHVLGKFFSSYIRKCSRPIRLEDFLSSNITKII